MRATVKAFARRMDQVLDDNDHKGGWADCTDAYLLGCLDEEIVELSNAVSEGGTKDG